MLRQSARPRQASSRPAGRRTQAASRAPPNVRAPPPRRPCARRSPSAGCPWRPRPRGARAARALHAAGAPAEAQGLQSSAADAGLSAASRTASKPALAMPSECDPPPASSGRAPAHTSSLPPRAAMRGLRMPAPWIAAGWSALPPCGWRKGSCKGYRAPRGPARPATRPDAPQPRRPACWPCTARLGRAAAPARPRR